MAKISYINFTSDANDQVNNYNMNLSGATRVASFPTYATSGSGTPNCLEFDGITDSADQDVTFLTSITEWTFNYWFKTTQTARHFQAAWRDNSAGRAVLTEFNQNATGEIAVLFYHDNVNNYRWVDAGAGVADGAWHMLTVTANESTGLVKFYLDGTLQDTSPSITFDLTNMATMDGIWGKRHWNPSGFALFNGQIDEITNFDSELDATAIQNLYNYGQTTTPGINDAITYYSMDNEDVSGVVLYDVAGTNNGTLNNITADTGKVANARSFNGSSSYIGVPQQVITDLIAANAWTISCWIKHGSTIDAQGEYIFAGGNGGNFLGSGIGINIKNSGEFRAFVGYSNANPIAESSAIVNDDNWHHVVATYDGTTVQLYIDSQPDGSVSAPSPTWSTANNVEIGKLGNSRHWDGLIDEFAIYDRTLSSTEVSELWNSGDGINPYNILNDALIYLPFDTDANDASGNNNNGVLTNNASISAATKKVGAGSLEMDNDTGNQYVNLSAHIADVAGNTNGSIALWFRLNEKNRNQGLVTVGDFGNVSSRFRLAYFNTPDEINVSINNGSWVIAYETVTAGFNTNTWYHLVLTQNGTASKLYINGEEAVITGGSNTNSGNWFASMTNLDTFRIGARAYSDDWFLDGFVDEFAYYTRALTPTQVRHLYNEGNGQNPYASIIPAPVNVLNGNQTWQMTLNDGVADRTVTFWKTKIFDSWREDKNSYVWVGGYTYSLGANEPDYGRTEYYANEPTQQDIVNLFDNTLGQ